MIMMKQTDEANAMAVSNSCFPHNLLLKNSALELGHYEIHSTDGLILSPVGTLLPDMKTSCNSVNGFAVLSADSVPAKGFLTASWLFSCLSSFIIAVFHCYFLKSQFRVYPLIKIDFFKNSPPH